MYDCANRDKVLNEKILRWRVDSNASQRHCKNARVSHFLHFVRSKSAFSAEDGW